MTDLLSLRYIPISQAELFDNNAKLHNLDQIIESITRYGFKSAAKWESTLNGERGGIVAGNGRVEALREMERRGDDLPIGIAQDTETGEWCVPVLFGVEASSEAIARAYAWDDNLILTGGMLAIDELMKLYDPELLESELKSLSRSGESPLSIDFESVENSLQSMLAGSQNELPDESEWDDALNKVLPDDRQPFQEITFILHDNQIEIVKNALAIAKKNDFSDSPNKNSNGNALAFICEQYNNYDS